MAMPVTTTFDDAPTSNPRILDWVEQIAALTQPDSIHWVTGTTAENTQLCDQLVEAGTFTRLNPETFPNSFAAFSDPKDVARVEEQTYICTDTREHAGFTNNWMEPQLMRSKLHELFEGSMRGRTMYVIPFVMGHLDETDPKFGIEITDSAYVVASMRIMARIGTEVLNRIDDLDASFVPAVHSVGAPLAPDEADSSWPCNDEKWIVHFPESREIFSYGSGYGGNALLGKKCFALRIASAMARDEGWLAEHMLILKVTSPQDKAYYLSAAFPSACGKTNLALLEPTVPGWKVETLGDDIAWLRKDAEGQLRAINPETGLFGVAPGTGWSTNPNAMRAIARGNSIFTNVALTDDGGVWWQGMTDEAPAHLIDWQGNDWTPETGAPAAHPNSRFCTPIEQIDMLADEYSQPNGVPISAILFGGRRKTTVPLVTESTSWNNGVFYGSTLSSETTAAAAGAVGRVRRDPMAMLPFIGYNAGEYLQHWITVGAQSERTKLPRIFLVNWFRRTPDGGFAWPGFSENSRVLEWVIRRLEDSAEAERTALGFVPTSTALNTEGLDLTAEELAAAIRFDAHEWLGEIDETNPDGIAAWYERFGNDLPEELHQELAGLKERLLSESL